MRSRLAYAAATLGVIALGLASRQVAALGKYPGDALWALMVFTALGALLPRASTWKLALAALCFAYCVELSQLYRAEWLDALRATTVGHLVLGSAFHALDLVAYLAGVMLGVLAERACVRPHREI